MPMDKAIAKAKLDFQRIALVALQASLDEASIMDVYCVIDGLMKEIEENMLSCKV